MYVFEHLFVPMWIPLNLSLYISASYDRGGRDTERESKRKRKMPRKVDNNANGSLTWTAREKGPYMYVCSQTNPEGYILNLALISGVLDRALIASA
jgi:hypothetical protein